MIDNTAQSSNSLINSDQQNTDEQIDNTGELQCKQVKTVCRDKTNN